MIEEVKKILRELLNDCQRGLTTFSRKRLDSDAQQICQLVRQEMVEEILELIDKKLEQKAFVDLHIVVDDIRQELKRKWGAK